MSIKLEIAEENSRYAQQAALLEKKAALARQKAAREITRQKTVLGGLLIGAARKNESWLKALDELLKTAARKQDIQTLESLKTAVEKALKNLEVEEAEEFEVDTDEIEGIPKPPEFINPFEI